MGSGRGWGESGCDFYVKSTWAGGPREFRGMKYVPTGVREWVCTCSETKSKTQGIWVEL